MSLLPGQVWLALAWLWLVWPLLLVLHPAGTPRRIFVPVFIGVVLIAPCMATIFLFTAWALDSSGSSCAGARHDFARHRRAATSPIGARALAG